MAGRFVTVLKRHGSRGLVPIETKSETEIAVIIARGSDLRTPFRRIVREGRAMVSEEFEKQSYRQPSGGFVAWDKTKPFGNREAPNKTLHRTGALRGAWEGGAGGYEEVTRTFATFGVLGLGRYVDAVREGANIPVTRKMRLFLGLEFGVWMRADRKTIRIQPRRHADLEKSVEFAERAAAILAEYVQFADERRAA